MMLKHSSDKKYPRLISDLSGKASSSSLLSMMLSICICIGGWAPPNKIIFWRGCLL